MPRPGASARRYADAAFEIADRDGTLDAWREGLQRAGDLLGDQQVAELLRNPALPLERRAELIDRALGADALPPLRNLVVLLLRRGRVQLLPRVAEEFRRLYNRRHGVITATATSAAPLDEQELRALTARLEQLTGARVQLSLATDPDLLGGVIVRYGDRLMDGSVRGRLERLRAELAATAR